MSDIFISYAKEDRERIMPLVRALEQTGWSVFWDRTIPVSKTWQQVISEEVDNCRCMIVVWSDSSIHKDWVYEEAGEGKRRSMLFPVMIDDVLPPLGFRSIQAANLVGWDGIEQSMPFPMLIRDMSEILGPIPTEAEEKKKAAEIKRKRSEEEAKQKAEIQKHEHVEAEQKLEEIKAKQLAVDADQKRSEEQARRKNEEQQRSAEKAAGFKTKKAGYGVADRQVLRKPFSQFYVLTAFAMVFAFFFREWLGNASISFYVIALFLVAYIGNRYGSKAGLISGLVAFLPLLMMHLLGPSLGDFTAKGALGRIVISDGGERYTLGLGYIFFGSVGFMTGLIRERMSEWSSRYDFIETDKSSSTNIFGLLAVSYLTALYLDLEGLRLDLAGLYFLIPMYIAYRFGLVVTYRYLFFMLPLFMLNIDIGGTYDIVDYYGLSLSYQEVVLFLLCTNVIGYLRSDISATQKINYGRFILLLVIAILLIFDYSVSKTEAYRGENIVLPFIFLAGSILGPRGGFLFGMLWAGFKLFDLRLLDYLSWGAFDMHILVAPIFGYLGGSLLTKQNFLKFGAILFMIFQGYILLATLLSTSKTSSRPEFYKEWVVGVLAGLISLAICSAIRKYFANGEPVKKELDHA